MGETMERKILFTLITIGTLAVVFVTILSSVSWHSNGNSINFALDGTGPNTATKVDLPSVYLKDGILRYMPDMRIAVECNNEDFRSFSSLNTEGFRDENFSDDEHSIGIFGDSFVMGLCLKDEEKIDNILENKLAENNLFYNVFNFGVVGYNLNSTLILLNHMAEKYDLDYSIVYFHSEDDIIPCDLTCRFKIKEEDPERSGRIEKDPYAFIEEQHKNHKENLDKNLDLLIREKVIDSGLSDKTEIIFFVMLGREQDEEVVVSTLEKYGISYILFDYWNQPDEYKVPGDGHPSETFNEDMSELFLDKIKTLESNK